MFSLLVRRRAGAAITSRARQVAVADRRGAGSDAGNQRILEAIAEWLCDAQDLSRTKDGGVARDFSLLKGWNSSYPETSGYIVPTLINLGLEERARRCLDWLVSIQFPEGGFQGGMVDQTPRIPVTFNTGQILLGLADGASRLDRRRYLQPMRRAAVWLRDSLDPDGCWRKHPTPFAAPGEKAYETHVSWSLFEADRVSQGEGFGEAGLRQVDWALRQQQPNGWFRSNCLDKPAAPLTHTIGYVMRGVLEAWRWSGDDRYYAAVERLAHGILPAIPPDGRLPGRLDSKWRGVVPWVCLTGNSQIAHCLLLLDKPLFREAAGRLLEFVRRTVAIEGSVGERGGVRGCFPIDGEYGRFQYLNWAAKFTVDALQVQSAE